MTDHSSCNYRARRASAPISIESLEKRRLLSAAPAADGPVITGETFIGPVTALTAVVLQFNQHLDPATANNLKAYHIGRNFGSSDSGGGFDPVGLLFAVHQHPPKSPAPGGKDLPFALHPATSLGGASYDDANQTVTITSAHAFRANVFLRFIRVAGNGPNAVRNSNGVALDGVSNNHPGTSAVIRYRFRRTNNFSYTDAQKNHVTLKISGPGQMMIYIPRRGNPSPLVDLIGTTADSSILTGTLKPGKNSDGKTTLQELSGTSNGQIQLPSSFIITHTQS